MGAIFSKTVRMVGDPEELNALDLVFCKGRNKPLPIGSVKSNIGHSEPASALCSITKVLIAMETGFIPPNLHYNNPRDGIEALEKGRLQVVTDKQSWNGSLVGVNSFGFGGANAHVLLKWNEKTKINGGAPKDSLPRLVIASGRTEEAVDVILKDFENRPVDAEYVYLLQDLQSTEIPGHIFRGYTLLSGSNKKIRSIQYYPGSKRPVWFVFTGMGSQWPGMGKSLLKIPIFAAAIDRCQRALRPHGIDLFNIITSSDPKIFDNILNCFVGIAACQIGLVDILKEVGIEADGIIGHSVGELGCGYADGCFTAEQMVLAAYYRGRASVETKLIRGLMAAVGLGAKEIRKLCPPDIEVACHNGPNFSTLSGPEESMKKFVKALQQNGVFAKEVNCANIAYHSKYIATCGPALLKYLRKVIPNPKPRSPRWVSSSVPESAWDSPLATHSSAEYHTNNLLGAVLFEEASLHIPHDAITIEIAPHGLLQAILNRSLNKATTNVALTQRSHPDCSELLLTSIGRLYELGLQPQLTNLYPKIHYPVSRGTPMLSPLIRWEHSEDWYVTSYRMQEKVKSGERTVLVTLDDEELEYISGHTIDGRVLFPATGYIALVWESIGLLHGQLYTDLSVVFESVQFHRATNIPKDGSVELLVMVQKGSGKFEIAEGGTAVVSGLVRVPENVTKETVQLDLPEPEEDLDKDLIELNPRDIYKELRLRGYNYQGLFRSLVSVDPEGKSGKIRWSNNWVAFMDNLLQMQILQEDTRSLFVPTALEKLTIDTKKHIGLIQELKVKTEAEPELDVYVYNDLNIIRCGGIEVRGLKASAISRRKPLGDPVLEKHMFVPYKEPEELDLNSSLRTCVHIVLENQQEIHVKTVEQYRENITILSPEIAVILGDLPLIQADITLLANPNDPAFEELNPEGFKIEDNKLSGEQNCLLAVVPDIINNTDVLQTAMNSLADGGFILVRERLDTEINLNSNLGLQIAFERSLNDEKLILLKKVHETDSPIVIHVTSNNYEWLPQVQTAVTSNSKPITYLVAQKEPLNGILGLVNCIRKEPGGENVRCVFILDETAPEFDINLPFYEQQLNKGLAVNIYSNGKWGSYRHIKLSSNSNTLVPHAYANVLQRGDLSTLKWLEGNINPNRFQTKPREELIHVYYSALNFRDIMTATGKLAIEVIAKGRMNQECVQGLEFAGRNTKGERVMGMVNTGALSSLIYADIDLMWKFPDHWSFEDAATVPVVYGTAYYALMGSGRMKKGDTVLIHAGSGGVGQAAINVCLHTGCTVFTTVGTEEKREFIKKRFPQLTDRNIGNSRDTSFEQLVMLETDGKGVDLVLNSLAEEKLQASLRCLAVGGRFLEIGKFDLANNNALGMEVFLKETSFHGIMLDNIFLAPPSWKVDLHKAVEEGMKTGAVQPLTRTVFSDKEVEQAFRFMAAGKHIGKVLIKVRPEEDERVIIPVLRPIEAVPRYFCKQDSSYLITGGLGGFGLELADWLVLRGARKLVLTSRKGLKTGYQSSRIRIWRNYGAKVEISLADITTENGVKSLITQANNLGPVDAIFNLAVVLQDALLENQSESSFIASAGPKPIATQHLDVLSRELCPALRHFVVFSSVSCGRGNAGQTNYGMNNSIMERICEARVRDGFPGLAVQWGAVGDVGLVADMQEENTEVVIGGTLPQRITSCLDELDKFLKQPYPIVASMVVAEKRSGSGGSGSLVDCVSNILGIRDLKTVSLHSTLAELGMDSMMAVEIKQSLEREFEVFLTAQEIRSLTFARLGELAAAKQETEDSKQDRSLIENPTEIRKEGLELLLRVVGDETKTSQTIMHLPSAIDVHENVMKKTLYMLPGIECVASVLEPLAKNLNYQTICLQMGYRHMGETVQEMAKSLLPHIRSRLTPGDPFCILGYSFGGLIALEIAVILEEEGFEGIIYLVDSSPRFMKLLQETHMGKDMNDIDILCAIFRLLAPKDATVEMIAKLIEELTPFSGFTERFNHFLKIMPPTDYSMEYQKAMGNAFYTRMMATTKYEWLHKTKLSSQIVLIRPPSSGIIIDDDYELSKISDKEIEVHIIPGNHGTILENMDTATVINEKLTKK